MYKILFRAITLLEVVIVMVILAIASAVVSININKALVEQRFMSEVDLIVSQLRLAQDIMLIMGVDSHLHFSSSKNNEGIEYWLETETNLPQNVQREVQRRRKKLTAIKGVFFKDELPNSNQENHITVSFLSKGDLMSKGIIRLATSSDENIPKGTLERFIYLPGYPKPIVSSRTIEESQESYQELDEDLDTAITRNTMLNLPESVKSQDTSEKPVEDTKIESGKRTNKEEKKIP